MRAMRDHYHYHYHYHYLQFKWVVGVANDSFQPQNCLKCAKTYKKHTKYLISIYFSTLTPATSR